MRSCTRSRIKTYISSREDIRGEIDLAFKDCYRRTTSCPELHKDIETYIELSIEERRLNGDLVVCEDSLVEAVKSALVQGAKGMYAAPPDSN